jgi:GT2 family glycosyltransferase
MFKVIGRRITQSSRAAWIRWCSRQIDLNSLMNRLTTDVGFRLIVTANKGEESGLIRTIQSVRAQAYRNWQLTVIAGEGTLPQLDRAIADDRRIRLQRPTDCHSDARESDILNSAFRYIGFVDATVQFEPDALAWIALTIGRHQDARWIYCDHVQTGDSGDRLLVCKPDFSAEHLLSCMFTGPFNVFRADVVRQAGGIDRSLGNAAVYDLALRVSELTATSDIHHLPEFLYSAVGKSLSGVERCQQTRVLEEAYRRRGVGVTIRQVSANPPVYQPRFLNPPDDSVVVIIPTRNQAERLKKCISSAQGTSRHPNVRYLVIDNQSDDPALIEFLGSCERRGELAVERFDEPFNYARMHNRAIRNLACDFVLLLNNDVYGFSPNWIEQLVATANLSRDIACVGCLLKFPDGTTQHGGVTFGIGRPCRHAHIGVAATEPGYCGRLQAMQELSAVTAALALMRRSAFLEVGGFDEQRFPISYNDTDLCLKLRAAGYRIIYNPAVSAVHEESVSRGKSDLEKSWRRDFQAKWGRSIVDPFYSPHLSRRSFTSDPIEMGIWRQRKRLALSRSLRAA